MASPVSVEVITYAPTEFYHCLHCEVIWHDAGIGPKVHAEQRATSLPSDLARQYEALSVWARHVADRFGDRVTIRVVDAASLEGFYKSIRYNVHRYPAFVVMGPRGRATVIGDDYARVTEQIERCSD